MIFKKIFVLGAGAVGSTYGALLSKKEDVTLIGRKPHVDAIKSNGLFLYGAFEGQYQVKAAIEITEIPSNSLIILSTKVTGSRRAIERVKPLVRKDTVVLLLQNGLGIEDLVKRSLPNQEVIRAVATMGAEFLEPGKISGVVLHRTDLEKSKSSERIAKLLRNCGLFVAVSDNINVEIWMKLTINSVLNPLTAIFQVKGYEIVTNSLKSIRHGIMDECLKVAKAEGIDIDEAIKELIDVGLSNYSNYSSMCQDILKKRRTEISFLNGRVVELGKKHNIPTPINGLMVDLVEFLEERSEKRDS